MIQSQAVHAGHSSAFFFAKGSRSKPSSLVPPPLGVAVSGTPTFNHRGVEGEAAWRG